MIETLNSTQAVSSSSATVKYVYRWTQHSNHSFDVLSLWNKWVWQKENIPLPECLVKWESLLKNHCVKSVRIRSISSPYFPGFEQNTERYGVIPRIHSECEKIRTRKTPNTDTFHAVKTMVKSIFTILPKSFCIMLMMKLISSLITCQSILRNVRTLMNFHFRFLFHRESLNLKWVKQSISKF